jgi:SAM-dependent methyltransferase
VTEQHLCPVCGTVADSFGPGPGGRPGATCTRCGALERHRFLAALLLTLHEHVGGKVVLDVAPSRQVSKVVRRLLPARHLRIDFDPTADRRAVDIQASLTALPLPDRSVDTLVCYHVLEHIPDDAAAMREIARVLRPEGVGFVQVPFRANTRTDEDPDAPVDERIRRFGQADHVRFYGDDFEERLQAAGLRFLRIDPRDVVGDVVGSAMNVLSGEFVWLVWPDGSDTAPVDLRELPQAVLGRLVLLWADLSAAEARKGEELTARAAELRRSSTSGRQCSEPATPVSVRADATRLARRIGRGVGRRLRRLARS